MKVKIHMLVPDSEGLIKSGENRFRQLCDRESLGHYHYTSSMATGSEQAVTCPECLEILNGVPDAEESPPELLD